MIDLKNPYISLVNDLGVPVRKPAKNMLSLHMQVPDWVYFHLPPEQEPRVVHYIRSFT